MRKTLTAALLAITLLTGAIPALAADPPVCGDTIIDAPETCDDGNTTSGDGCDSSCLVEPTGPTCGDYLCEGGETEISCPADCAAVPFIDEATANQFNDDLRATVKVFLIGIVSVTLFTLALASGLMSLGFRLVLDAIANWKR